MEAFYSSSGYEGGEKHRWWVLIEGIEEKAFGRQREGDGVDLFIIQRGGGERDREREREREREKV